MSSRTRRQATDHSAAKAAAAPASPGAGTPHRAVRRSAAADPAAPHGPQAQAYHHGALRPALLAAAREVLAERGAGGLTLRECARRAGVSHAAPAHHFGDVRGLLTALAAQGFEQMADLMDSHRATAPPDPAQQLVAVGQAYIEFATTQRAHFQLMFGSDRLDAADPTLLRSSARTRAALEQTMTALMASRDLPPETLPTRLLLAWSAVHGFATLVNEGQCEAALGLDPAQPTPVRAAAAAVLALLQPALAGHGAEQPGAAVAP
jgi:AcrR family transcriptional regulator